MIKASVFYDNDKNARFDENYFLENHIPLVKEKLNPLGMVKIEVEKGLSGVSPDEPAKFQWTAHMYFESIEKFGEAFGKEGEGLVSDVPNYTELKPVFQISEVID